MTPAQARVAETITARRRIKGGEARATRKRLGVTLIETGAALGVAHSTVSQWERGINRPGAYAAVLYMRFLDELSGLDAAGIVA